MGIKSKRKPLYQGGIWGVSFLFALYDLIRSYIKPKVLLDFLIESTPALYSVAETQISDSVDDKSYLLVNIKCKRKAIGNVKLDVVGHFYNISENKILPIRLIFEKPPEVIEVDEEINLKCLTEINLHTVINMNSKMIVNIIYDYEFVDSIRSVSQASTWAFALDNDTLTSNQLMKVG